MILDVVEVVVTAVDHEEIPCESGQHDNGYDGQEGADDFES